MWESRHLSIPGASAALIVLASASTADIINVPGDQPTIQAGIDAALDGDQVVVAPGNYNETTARLYSDISLLTCNDELGSDATSFFHAVTGYSQPQKFRKIESAPLGMRALLLEMIQRKISGPEIV